MEEHFNQYTEDLWTWDQLRVLHPEAKYRYHYRGMYEGEQIAGALNSDQEAYDMIKKYYGMSSWKIDNFRYLSGKSFDLYTWSKQIENEDNEDNDDIFSKEPTKTPQYGYRVDMEDTGCYYFETIQQAINFYGLLLQCLVAKAPLDQNVTLKELIATASKCCS